MCYNILFVKAKTSGEMVHMYWISFKCILSCKPRKDFVRCANA